MEPLKPNKVMKSSHKTRQEITTQLQVRCQLCTITLRDLVVHQVDNTPAYIEPLIGCLFDLVCQDFEKNQLDFIHGSNWPSVSDPGPIQRYIGNQLFKSIRAGLNKFASATPAGLQLGLEQLYPPENRSQLEPILRSLMDRNTEAGLDPDRHLMAAVTQSGADGRLRLCYERLTEDQVEAILAEFQLRLRRPPIVVSKITNLRAHMDISLPYHVFDFKIELRGNLKICCLIYIAIEMLPPRIRTLQRIVLCDKADKWLATVVKNENQLRLLDKMSQCKDLNEFPGSIERTAESFGLPKAIAKALLEELVLLYRKYKATNRFGEQRD